MRSLFTDCLSQINLLYMSTTRALPSCFTSPLARRTTRHASTSVNKSHQGENPILFPLSPRFFCVFSRVQFVPLFSALKSNHIREIVIFFPLSDLILLLFSLQTRARDMTQHKNAQICARTLFSAGFLHDGSCFCVCFNMDFAFFYNKAQR